MIDTDIVVEKVASIRQCLKRITDKTDKQPESLKDIDIQDIFVLNLQRAIQSAIDLGAHIVADEDLGTPETLSDNFELLEKANVISQDLSERMKKMVGFRNIAVHAYQDIAVSILQSILQENLGDLETFYGTVLENYDVEI